MDNVYLIYYITEDSNSETFNSGCHIWAQSTRKAKNRIQQRKKAGIFHIFICTTNSCWRAGEGVKIGGEGVIDVFKVSTEVLVQYVNSRSTTIEVTQFKGPS